jgi:hypothetical protein
MYRAEYGPDGLILTRKSNRELGYWPLPEQYGYPKGYAGKEISLPKIGTVACLAMATNQELSGQNALEEEPDFKHDTLVATFMNPDKLNNSDDLLHSINIFLQGIQIEVPDRNITLPTGKLERNIVAQMPRLATPPHTKLTAPKSRFNEFIPRFSNKFEGKFDENPAPVVTISVAADSGDRVYCFFMPNESLYQIMQERMDLGKLHINLSPSSDGGHRCFDHEYQSGDERTMFYILNRPANYTNRSRLLATNGIYQTNVSYSFISPGNPYN